MNSLDFAVITYVNRYSQHWWILDSLMLFLESNNLFKGGVLVIIIWWAWFRGDERLSHNREHLISILFSSIVAIMLGRALALTLPFRLRPLHEKNLSFLLPYGMNPATLESWSSFPSDHAVLFFTLSTGLIFISRKIGAFALSYTVLFISFPRIYVGLHYPTDIIAGAVIGMTVALLVNRYHLRIRYIPLIVNWSYKKPSLFYPCFFFLTYQIANLFDGSRALITTAYKLLKHIIA